MLLQDRLVVWDAVSGREPHAFSAELTGVWVCESCWAKVSVCSTNYSSCCCTPSLALPNSTSYTLISNGDAMIHLIWPNDQHTGESSRRQASGLYPGLQLSGACAFVGLVIIEVKQWFGKPPSFCKYVWDYLSVELGLNFFFVSWFCWFFVLFDSSNFLKFI